MALPTVQRDLHASLAGLQWIADAYLLVVASLLILAGSMADRLGRKRLFLVGLFGFSLGSLLCSLAPDTGSLIALRMLQGVGGSMLTGSRMRSRSARPRTPRGCSPWCAVCWSLL